MVWQCEILADLDPERVFIPQVGAEQWDVPGRFQHYMLEPRLDSIYDLMQRERNPEAKAAHFWYRVLQYPYHFDGKDNFLVDVRHAYALGYGTAITVTQRVQSHTRRVLTVKTEHAVNPASIFCTMLRAEYRLEADFAHDEEMNAIDCAAHVGHVTRTGVMFGLIGVGRLVWFYEYHTNDSRGKEKGLQRYSCPPSLRQFEGKPFEVAEHESEIHALLLDIRRRIMAQEVRAED